ncbi:hypothetical protein EG329_014374 [Mollisiaceae sp. DMI_Dod_QoI]|nr:hypothetical protein EG329_014374 [Helotiales sp. DMI_Dod_QoI]
MSGLPIEKHVLSPPPLSSLVPILTSGLQKNFSHVSVSVSLCPDLTLAPFHLAAPGLCGNEYIIDLGGPPYLHPAPDFTKKYSFSSLISQISSQPSSSPTSNQNEDKEREYEAESQPTFLLGAAAGPFHTIGQNSELMPNLLLNPNSPIKNLTHYSKISPSPSGPCISGPIPSPHTPPSCALMANLFCSTGLPGPVLKISAKHRIGSQNFLAPMQNALQEAFGNEVVSFGGVFLVRRGRVRCHVMPDFETGPLEQERMGEWLRWFEWEGKGLVFLCTAHSRDPGWGLRLEHTHCFDGDGDGEREREGRGGHYHGDVEETRGEVEYEGYFNVARCIYRVDRPAEGE